MDFIPAKDRAELLKALSILDRLAPVMFDRAVAAEDRFRDCDRGRRRVTEASALRRERARWEYDRIQYFAERTYVAAGALRRILEDESGKLVKR